jgi:hypothetical protein
MIAAGQGTEAVEPQSAAITDRAVVGPQGADRFPAKRSVIGGTAPKAKLGE